MSILCLEGASAVGKSTVSRLLEDKYNFERIPEVKALFDRPKKEPKNWYLEKQIARWRIAKKISDSGRVAVLDGDPFQPIWYNWIYPNDGFQPIQEIIQFYEEKLHNAEIDFPHRYFILSTSIENLRSRKSGDQTSSRSSFEKHLQLIEPQKKYFHSIKDASKNTISFVNSNTPESVADKIQGMAKSAATKNNNLVFEAIRRLIEINA